MSGDGLGRVLRKLRGRTPHELLVRARQAGALVAERNGPMGHGVSLDSCALRLARLAPLANILSDSERRPALPAWDDPSAIGRESLERWPAAAAAVVARADAALAGHISLLGHGALDFGQPIDWHLDPLRNRRAPQAHWSRVAYLDAAVVGDHKVIWELNRHQHLVTLAQAFLLTGKDRYASGAVAQLQSWMDHNPPKLGINWASSLEISFRSIAWCWMLHLLRGHPALTARSATSALACLELNARHIESYPSTYFAPNTHLTGEGLGLLYIGCSFPELPGAARWRLAGWRILADELDRQVLPDGVYYEQSTYYQRYVLDIHVHALLLAGRAGIRVPGRIREGIQRLAGLLETVMGPDGGVPLIGDDDGGRLLPLSCAAGNDVRPALAAAERIATSDPGEAWSAEAGFETLWLAGGAPVCVRATPRATASRVFPAGGLVVLRHGVGHDANIMVLDAGQHGPTRTNGVHSHADALAFDLVVLGRRMLVDPGTFTYVVNPEERDRFRSTMMHNTVTVGDGSSSVALGPFGWAVTRHARVESWAHGTDFDYVSALLQGYGRIGAQVVHRREVLFLHALGWFMRDRVSGHPGGLPVRLHFHAAPGVAISTGAPGVAGFTQGDTTLLLRSTPCEAMTAHDDRVSPLYGAVLPSRSLTLTAPAGGLVDVATAMIPHRPGAEPPLIISTPGTAHSVQVQRGGESWQIGFGDLAAGEGLQSDAPVAWTLERGSRLARIGSVAGSVLGHPDAPAFATTAASWRSASHDEGSWTISTGPIRTGAT